MSPIEKQARVAHKGQFRIAELNPKGPYNRCFSTGARHVPNISNPEFDGEIYVFIKKDVAKILLDTKDGRVYGAMIFKGAAPGPFMQRYDSKVGYDPFTNQDYMTDVSDLESKINKVLQVNREIIQEVLRRSA